MKETKRDKSLQILDAFNEKYFDENSVKNHEIEIAELFEKNFSQWERYLDFLYKTEKEIKKVDEMLGNALLIYSAVVDCSCVFSKNRLKELCKWVDRYEKKVDFSYQIKVRLFENIADIYAKKGSDREAVEYYKKGFFYSFSDVNHITYEEINCFAFHSLSKFMLYSLGEETLNVSSPLKFNDVFDCPLIKLLNNDVGPSKLRMRALCDCVKIACFDKNEFLPTVEDLLSKAKRKKNKKNDEKEYCNELLWSHYADYHKGVCVEYVFNSSLFKNAQNDSSIVSFFKDVEYLDNIDSIKKGTAINLLDGFFVKSKAWKYENELRFFHFNLRGSGDYESVKIPNTVKSITFGAQCPENDKILVMKLMRNRKYVVQENGKKVQKKIEFYQMKTDATVFGKLNRESICLYRGKILVK